MLPLPCVVSRLLRLQQKRHSLLLPEQCAVPMLLRQQPLQQQTQQMVTDLTAGAEAVTAVAELTRARGLVEMAVLAQEARAPLL